MKLNRIRWSITIGAIVLIVAHHAFPRFSLDAPSLILLVIALIPVSRDAARWMLEVGPTVLTILDQTIARREG